MALESRLPPLDDRSYDDIRKEARQRIARYTPEWTDFNDGDAGMALVETFAFMTDMLLYRLNRMPLHARLKFLDMVGITLQAARPAQAYLSFAMEQPWPQATVEVPARTQVAAAADEQGAVVFETERRLLAFAAELAVVRSCIGGAVLDRSSQNAEAATPWALFSDSPDPGAALLLGFAYDGAFPARSELALTFWLDQGLGRAPLRCGGAHFGSGVKIAWEGYDGRDWRAVSLLADETAGFFRSGQVLLQTPAAGVLQRVALGGVAAPHYWLRARVVRGGWDRPPMALAVRINTVPASQGETVEGEILGGSDGSVQQTLRLGAHPVLDGTLQLSIDEGDGRGFLRWQEVDDFVDPEQMPALDAQARRERRFYVLNRSQGEVRLDGRRAHAPAANPERPDASVRADRYRHGGGRRGNVAAGALNSLLTPVAGIDAGKTSNLFAADGGADEETLEAAELRGARSIRSRGRAVTGEDFEQIALSAGPVGRARALPLFHPDFPGTPVPGVVTVVIVPDQPGPAPMPSAALLRCVCAALDQARLLGTEVYVAPPTYLAVRVVAELVAEAEADPALLKAAALQALATLFDPLRGGADGRGWPFGGDIHFSRVHHALLLPGVARLGAVEVTLDGTTYPACSDIALPAGALLAAQEHEVSILTADEEDMP
ncbi:putative baseplate assembly protein [Massilia sp. BJB1822]|uniref:putative baseplate assembly protein n=1 Tax=Massilia sp. BJB1822 TaxID=2744470 RepID=UPI001594411F|nr:putative baseplate assembly protein [Massilia sp. BJB1822]NVD97973.1 putative baseplate assembly protein [Massilia sp. BJB1822]